MSRHNHDRSSNHDEQHDHDKQHDNDTESLWRKLSDRLHCRRQSWDVGCYLGRMHRRG